MNTPISQLPAPALTPSGAKAGETTDFVSRRRFVLGASTTLALASVAGLQAQPSSGLQQASPLAPNVLAGKVFDLVIDYQSVNFTGRKRIATTVNGQLPGPTLRWKEGERVTLRVTNKLQEDTSIHWHGIILPSSMDGSPGFDSEPIKPGTSFEYQFDVQQNGTYWYHSHSGLQEQTGLLGAIVIEPKDPDPVAFDREMTVLLSDWSDEAPQTIYAKLKKRSHYYNVRERTLADTWQEVKSLGIAGSFKARQMWNQMRMSERDIADVTGYTYTYLMNGMAPAANWTGLFKKGERLRLRIINGAAMTFFDIRIPGLTLTLVAADGQNIQPVEVDEFRIAPAETYDLVITPNADTAYCLFAQAMDRSGFACGTLTPNPALTAPIPPMDPAPVLGHQDMGMGAMDHGSHGQAGNNTMDHSAHIGHEGGKQNAQVLDHSAHAGHHMETEIQPASGHSTHATHATHAGHMDHASHDMGKKPNQAMDHSEHAGHSMGAHSAHITTNATPKRAAHEPTPLAKAGFGSNIGPGAMAEIRHSPREFGPHVDMVAASPASGLADPGIGLREHQARFGRRVLRYADLKSLHPTRDKRQPSREIELHLTGNMHRYMWSINGQSFMNAEPLLLTFGERVRIILVNDTMMTHPFHLHGMWSELETGDPDYIPRKHTVIVQPGSRISYLVTADAKGRWAYHCHLLYHMLGMMRTVQVI